jgi:hypothetical protein
VRLILQISNGLYNFTYEMDSIKKKVLEKLFETKGIVTHACANANIARSTFYDWVATDSEFKLAVEEINETAIDFVESKLMEKINGVKVQTFNQNGKPVVYDVPPSDTALIFFLKTRGKKRGYIERVELDSVSPIQLLMNNPLTDIDQIDNDITK